MNRFVRLGTRHSPTHRALNTSSAPWRYARERAQVAGGGSQRVGRVHLAGHGGRPQKYTHGVNMQHTIDRILRGTLPDPMASWNEPCSSSTISSQVEKGRGVMGRELSLLTE
ncbi:hypothetical protein PG984_014541 [Apiospora sp. TS-2023a]